MLRSATFGLRTATFTPDKLAPPVAVSVMSVAQVLRRYNKEPSDSEPYRQVREGEGRGGRQPVEPAIIAGPSRG